MNTSLKQNRTNGKFNSNSEKSQEWQQEREARIGLLLVKQLEEGVASIQSSEDFKRWLAVVSRFHTYSLNNQLLILFQFPGATRVAGYRTWQSLGRQVKKGSKGISILAPRPYERIVKDQQAGTEEVLQGLSFRTVSVFDISQTEGEALPQMAPDQLQGQEGEELYIKLDELAEAEGLKVTHYDLQGGGDDSQTDYNGYYLPGSKLIFVKRAAKSQMVKTLAHELAVCRREPNFGRKYTTCSSKLTSFAFKW